MKPKAIFVSLGIACGLFAAIASWALDQKLTTFVLLAVGLVLLAAGAMNPGGQAARKAEVEKPATSGKRAPGKTDHSGLLAEIPGDRDRLEQSSVRASSERSAHDEPAKRLTRLASLRDRGILNEDEFEALRIRGQAGGEP